MIALHSSSLRLRTPIVSHATFVKLLSNQAIVPKFVNNRNPRNLEKLRIADKPQGWELDQEGRSYWNKVTLDITGRHISGRIHHKDGKVPISASTEEWCIKKYLYSTKDTSAAKAVGQVLADRCIRSGITEVACFFPEDEKKKEKVAVFLSSLEEKGISLIEPPQMYVPWALNYPYLDEKSWEVDIPEENK